jgi:hypothetical protein
VRASNKSSYVYFLTLAGSCDLKRLRYESISCVPGDTVRKCFDDVNV